MMKKVNIYLVAAVVMLLTACGRNERVTPLSEQIDSIVGRVFPDSLPGAAVLVMQGDSVLAQRCYGLADLETRQPVTPETNFCIASVSKQFAALALLQLVEQGKVSLDDPLRRFFGSWPSAVLDSVSVRHILSHTSGIPDARPRDDRDFVLHATDVASAQYIATLDSLRFQPGTKYEYINPTFQLIYQMIPAVTGVDFETYVHDHLLKLAGMVHTAYFEAGRPIEKMAHGYQWSDSLQCYVEFDYDEETFFATKADGGLYTSVSEFALWEKALREGKIVSDSTLRMAYTPVISIPEDANYGYQPHTGYGYGFFVQQPADGSDTVVYHTGDNGGFTIYAGKIPRRDITVMLFSTRNDIDRMGMVNAILALLKKN